MTDTPPAPPDSTRAPSSAGAPPVAAGTGRRLTGAVTDAVLALACGAVAGAAAGLRMADGGVALRAGAPVLWGTAACAAVLFSFLNQVLLTLAAGAGVGKLLTGLRVVTTEDGTRPGPLRLVRRWLFGFYWAIVLVPLHIAADSDVEQQDACGVRVVRRGHGPRP